MEELNFGSRGWAVRLWSGYTRDAEHLSQVRGAGQKREEGATMPSFMDRHDMSGMTAEDVAEVHRKDVEIQDKYGVGPGARPADCPPACTQ
jgi:hypothetical protein